MLQLRYCCFSLNERACCILCMKDTTLVVEMFITTVCLQVVILFTRSSVQIYLGLLRYYPDLINCKSLNNLQDDEVIIGAMTG